MTTDSRPLDLVRMPQAWASVPIFVPLKRGTKRPGMDVTLGAGRTEMRVRAYELLGIGDQDVLVALLRLAEWTENTSVLETVPVTDEGRRLRDGLEIECQGTSAPATAKRRSRRPAAPLYPEDTSLVVETTLNEVARRAGKTLGGKGRKVVNETLDRLTGVQIKVTDTETGSYVYSHLVHSVRYEAEGDRLRVALHPALAKVLLGGGGAVTRIAERDYLALEGEVARRLLVRLCSWVDAGTTRHARIETLAQSVWRDPSTNRSARSRRYARLAEALLEVGQLEEWEVAVTGSGASADVRITRRSRGAE